MRLRTSPEADRDIREIHIYGSEHFGVEAADRYIELIDAAFARLSEFPELGRMRDELRPPVRQLILRAHNVFYRFVNGEIVVVRLLHHSIDWIHEL